MSPSCARPSRPNDHAPDRYPWVRDDKERKPMSITETEGFLPRWTLKRSGIIAPEERLPWGQTLAIGLQHIFAMFGSTVLAPILMGFDPNTAIFFSGIG